MIPNPFDLWVLARVLADQPLNGELTAMADPWRDLAARLAATLPEGRQSGLDWFLIGWPKREAVVEAIAGQDPLGPAPQTVAPSRSYATLEDIAKIVAAQPWLWRGWIASGVLNAVASDPGIGKTRFALDVARRLWFGLPWPDTQPNDLPAGTRTLWVQGDRNFAEMLQCARDFGLPDDAVALGSSPDDPTGGLDLDDPAALADLETRIVDSAVALVVIDTVGMVTSRNLSRPEEARDFFAPIIEIAGRTKVPILGLTHLSMNKDPLGRRIVEKAQVVIKMTQPDPEGQRDRRRLWVDKTAITKPVPLGVTMSDKGNDFDFDPPKEPASTPRKPGPPPARLEECKTWLEDQLTPNPARVADIRRDSDAAGFSAHTLYKSRDALKIEEYTFEHRKWWSLPVVGDVGVSNSD
jgi:hypothetical protein